MLDYFFVGSRYRIEAPTVRSPVGSVFLLGVFLLGDFCVLLGCFFNFPPNRTGLIRTSSASMLSL